MVWGCFSPQIEGFLQDLHHFPYLLGGGILKWSKWCIRVPNTRKQAERTKIIIYVCPSSLYMSHWEEGRLLIQG